MAISIDIEYQYQMDEQGNRKVVMEEVQFNKLMQLLSIAQEEVCIKEGILSGLREAHAIQRGKRKAVPARETLARLAQEVREEA
ncbi:MAG: hypothetical protein KF690_01415 [Bacteroidetes bacterium]|nr:hypothetical protein [Bacteroidota bacterium]